jgi:carbon starvation protein
LWQLFGAANQLMAALSLLIVTVWLRSQKKRTTFVLWPMLFMYITTLAATLVTARNLTIIAAGGGSAAVGAWAMIVIAMLLFITALVIGWDGYQAYQRYAKGGVATKQPAATD